MSAPLTIALGPPAHGVTRFAVECAHAAGTEVLEVPDVAALQDTLAARPAVPVHLHVTDALFAATPDRMIPGQAAPGRTIPNGAAETIEALARDRPVAVTLHDVPQPAEGAERCRRRTRAYRRIAAVAGLVVVSSEHERHLCADAGIAVDVVIPLPVPDLGGAGARRTGGSTPDERSVGVFGFLHPGKAVDVVAQAVAELAAGGDDAVTLRLLGQPADGHEDYVRAAVDTVRSAGGRAELTGRIDDDELAHVLGEVTVPVALFRNVSASGSLNTWAAAGRRPLVSDSEYTREMNQRRPGSLLITGVPRSAGAADLAGDLRRLLDDPAPTRVEPPEPGLAELGRAYLRAWAGWSK